MRAIADGLVLKQVAAALDISLMTAKGHVRSVYDKLDVHTHAQAIAALDDLCADWRPRRIAA